MKTKLDEISGRIQRLHDQDRKLEYNLCGILKDLVEEVKRVDQKYQPRTDDFHLRIKVAAEMYEIALSMPCQCDRTKHCTRCHKRDCAREIMRDAIGPYDHAH